jgi:hypothetical protein
MSRNALERTAKAISLAAAKMATGIDQVGPSVPVTAITAALMRSNRTAFNTAENAFNKGRKAVSDAYVTYHAADDAVSEWLAMTRSVLVASFGGRWSTDWAAAGFVNHTTRIPADIPARTALANSLAEFLGANPSYEVASLNVTADYGDSVYQNAMISQSGVETAEQRLVDLDTARGTARTTVVGGMRSLIKNLEGELKGNDPRWLNFGLSMPASRVTPAKPTGLALSLSGADAIQALCDAMPLATRYRWRMRTVGPGNTFQLVASTTEPLALITPVPVGTMVEIIVQAVNDGLQSVASDPVAITIPAGESAAPNAASVPHEEAELAPLLAITPKTNGNSNGNGKRASARG